MWYLLNTRALITIKGTIMKLSKKEAEKLKELNIVEATHEAREECSQLINDQGFAMLSVAVSHFIADIAEHPEKLVKEFSH